MPLERQIRRLLLSMEVRRINFRAGTILITAYGYDKLSKRIGTQPISNCLEIEVNPLFPFPRGTDAGYSPSGDKLFVRSEYIMNARFGESVLVHELTHAQCDYRGVSTSERTSEGVAFIAEAWFMLEKGMINSVIDARVDQEIRSIAEDLRNQVRYGTHIPEVSRRQIRTARRIATSYGYRTRRFRGNGIRGQRLTTNR